jgi:hypothetical protein
MLTKCLIFESQVEKKKKSITNSFLKNESTLCSQGVIFAVIDTQFKSSVFLLNSFLDNFGLMSC